MALFDYFSPDNICSGGRNIFFTSMVIVWLAVVMLFTRAGIKYKKQYIDSIIVFSALWIFAMGICCFEALWGTYPFVENNLLIVIVSATILFLFTILGVTIYSIKKRFFSFRVILAFLLFGSPFFIITSYVVLDVLETFSWLAYVMDAIAFIIFVVVSIYMIMKTKRRYLTNILFLFGTLLFTIFFGLISPMCTDLQISTVNILVTFVIVIEFFILYSQIGADLIIEKDTNIEKKELALESAEEKIEALVFANPDTGLDNIRKLEHDLDNSIYLVSGMFMLTFDNYKAVSNTMGYSKTSTVMKQIASNIIYIIGEEGHLYQTANDRFVGIYTGEYDNLKVLVKKIMDSFVQQDLFTINLRPYVGYTKSENKTLVNFENILKQLELASEKALSAPEFIMEYNHEFNKAVQQRLLMETHLKNAVETKSWELYLQPKVSVATNMIIGAEGLIRWKGQESRITPAMFIPLAEELGLIVEIGKTIIEKGFAYCKAIVEHVMPDFILAINLSAYQLMRKDVISFVQKMQDKYEINPKNITFELTESAFIENMDRVKDSITYLRSLGYRFSLDDFGTGYSSISYLSSFELDEVKFDREFMKDITSDKKNLIILETVTSLAKKLGLKIVTEGVESSKQLDVIRQVGCEIYQGYYFSKPANLNDFVALMKENINGKYFGRDYIENTKEE